jgi:hypothetical protein
MKFTQTLLCSALFFAASHAVAIPIDTEAVDAIGCLPEGTVDTTTYGDTGDLEERAKTKKTTFNFEEYISSYTQTLYT